MLTANPLQPVMQATCREATENTLSQAKHPRILGYLDAGFALLLLAFNYLRFKLVYLSQAGLRRTSPASVA